jgi:hypothetical protein
VVLTSFPPAFFESRYVFHLYPLLVMVAAWAIVEVTSRAWRALRSGGRARRAVAVAGLASLAFLVAEDANPLEAWAVGSRTHQSPKDPFRSVISWAAYAHFHQDQKTPSRHVLEHSRPGDRVIAMGPPHAIGVYHFYLDELDYALGRPGDFSYYRRIEGKLVSWMTGSEILEGRAAIDAVLVGAPGAVWFLTDRPLLADSNTYYSEEIKEYVRSLVREPDYVGLDGETLVVKLTRPVPSGSGASLSRRGER